MGRIEDISQVTFRFKVDWRDRFLSSIGGDWRCFLNQRREQPGYAGNAAIQEVFAVELFGGGRGAVQEVLVELVGVVFGKGPVVDEGVDFKIEVEAADVYVAAADAYGVAVAGYGFGVEEAVVQIDLDPVFGGLARIGEAGPIDQKVVAAVGQHELDVNARSGRDAQGVHEAVIGDEVGRLN